ncbi:hypothetical protein pb186bvf_019960 [Paramecium bursaria]
MQKVQLRLQTVNQLLHQHLIPFAIIKADIETLKIDIPWTSLNSQPIKIQVIGLNVILEYSPIDIEDAYKNYKSETPIISVQNELRKHKEIDEKTLQKFIRKLILNMQFLVKDVQVEVLIKQQYRLQLILDEIKSYCFESFKPDDKFNRLLELNTFIIKLIRYKDQSYSNQQLISLDYFKAQIDKVKDISMYYEVNNLNLVFDNEILFLQEILNNYVDMKQQLENRLKNEMEQPSWESFILKDIISVNKCLKINLVLNSSQIQYQNLNIQIVQLDTLIKNYVPMSLPNFQLKLKFQQIELNYNQNSLILIHNQIKRQLFSQWPEFQDEDSKQYQIIIDLNTQYNQKQKKTLQKLNIVFSNQISINFQQILRVHQSLIQIQEELKSTLKSSKQETQQIISIVRKDKKNIQINLMVLQTSIKLLQQSQFLKLLIQFRTDLKIKEKNGYFKKIDSNFKLLQFDIIDQDQINNLGIIGCDIQLNRIKEQTFLDLQFIQININITNSLLQQIQSLKNIQYVQNTQEIKQQNEMEPIKQDLMQLQIKLAIQKIDINLCQTYQQSLIQLFKLTLYNIQAQINLLNQQFQQAQVQSKVKLYVQHPLNQISANIIKKFTINLNWNKENLLNNNITLSKIQVCLNPLTLQSLIHSLGVFSKEYITFYFKNETQKKVKFLIWTDKEEQEIILYPNQTSAIPAFDQTQIPQIIFGICQDNDQVIWSNPHTFKLNQLYFDKFTLNLDDQEVDYFIKANLYQISITQLNPLYMQKVLLNQVINQTPYTLQIMFQTFKDNLYIQKNQTLNLPFQIQDDEHIVISIVTQNIQQIKIVLKELLNQKGILSFNFVKIETSFFNVLITIEWNKNKEQNCIILKPFINIINLLPWSFQIGGLDLFNFPISVDAQMNNQVLSINDLDTFFNSLLENRKNSTNQSQQISINGVFVQQYFCNFLKESKFLLEINQSHHIIMGFRNNTLINNQLCFIVCRNIFQHQIKYLLLRNRTNLNFVLMKNKSRHHISQSDSCFEYNVLKGEKGRIFITDSKFELLQLLDVDTMEKHNLKVQKYQANNIHIIDISENQQTLFGKEFKIIIPDIQIDIYLVDQILQINLDLQIRLFKQYHLDILCQQFIVKHKNQEIIIANDCFSIIEAQNSQDLNIYLLNNFFMKAKDIKITISQQLINDMKQFLSVIKNDPLLIINQQVVEKSFWDTLQQKTVIIINLIIDPIVIDLNIQTNYLQLINQLKLPLLQMKMRKYTQNQFKQEILSHYIAYLITKIISIQLFLQNIRNPLQFLFSFKQDDTKHNFYSSQNMKSIISTQQYNFKAKINNNNYIYIHSKYMIINQQQIYYNNIFKIRIRKCCLNLQVKTKLY